MDWASAVDACTFNGDHLVHIESDGENIDVNNVLEHNFDNAFNEKFWIGLSNPNGLWTWENNQELSYKNWDVNQPGPQANGEDCGSIGWGNMKWHDAPCSLKMWPVCEVGPGSVAPPIIDPPEPVEMIMPAPRPMEFMNT